jgi:hypothetical protein
MIFHHCQMNNFINILKKTDAYICLMHMIEGPVYNAKQIHLIEM